MPDRQEMRCLADRAFEEVGIPDVVLGLDGTLIRLGKYPSICDLDPGLTPEMFTCRKWFASLNVMAVGDIDGLLRYIDVRWPGLIFL